MSRRLLHRQAGFTLVELAVVVVIIGVLAAFAIPKFRESVERTKAGEAVNYLATFHSSQERYHVRQGTYAGDIDELDVEFLAPEYFGVGAIGVPATESSLETGWELTLTRRGETSGFGAYTIVFNQDGFDPDNSTIPDEINPMQTGSTSGS